MGILSRFTDIMEANINALLDKCEDPAKMVDQTLRNLNENLADVKRETAGVMAEEKRAKRVLDEAKADVEKWDSYARKALKAGNEGDALITKGDFNKEDLEIYAIGKKGKDALHRHGYHIVEDNPDIIEEPSYVDAMVISDKLLKSFAAGEIGEIYLAYTRFKNTVVHEPTLLKLLPVEPADSKESGTETDSKAMMNFEPEDDEALDMIIPKYVTSLIYGGLVEAVASENGARMQAMDSATSNAEEMIDHLSLMYNRARQGSITQELTEIIAGANAIS